jgi:AcrR family transcriptional regulator
MSREQWLELSLDWLQKSKGHFRLDELVKALGVTTGSFYWHFKGRDDFIQALLDYWEEKTTSKVIAHMQRFAGDDASTRLLELMRVLQDKVFCNHDMAIRYMAVWHKGAAKKVRQVDATRYAFVQSLFAEIGYTGADLEARSHAFAVFHSLREGLQGKEAPDSEDELQALYRMFTS